MYVQSGFFGGVDVGILYVDGFQTRNDASFITELKRLIFVSRACHKRWHIHLRSSQRIHHTDNFLWCTFLRRSLKFLFYFMKAILLMQQNLNIDQIFQDECLDEHSLNPPHPPPPSPYPPCCPPPPQHTHTLTPPLPYPNRETTKNKQH